MMDLMQKAREIAAGRLKTRVMKLEIISGRHDSSHSVQSAHIALQQGEKLAEALRRLDYWFNADVEILDAMDHDTRADHDRQHGKIRQALAEWEAGQ